MIGIYKITNLINGKIYVGKSNNIDRRWREHCSPTRYLTSNIPVEYAINKYGKENFICEVLEECSLEELDAKETEWIDKLNSIENGYNCNRGGEVGTRGVQNPNAKLTEDDVYRIRTIYNNHSIGQHELYEEYKDKIAWGSFQSIWQGNSWPNILPEVYTEENKEYYKKAAGYKTNNTFSDEEIMEYRKMYVNKTAREIYSLTDQRISYETFQGILCGASYKYLPYYHKKTQTWIQPGETPQKNPNRGKRTNRMTTNAYTDEEVIELRKAYINKTYKELYEESDKRITAESFQKMLSGRTYSHLPVYSKVKKEWVYK